MKIKWVATVLVLFVLGAAWPDASKGHVPYGWRKLGSDPMSYDVGTDTAVVHHGKHSAYVKSVAASPQGYVTLAQACLTANYQGKRMRFTAWVKGQDVAGWAGLWTRVDDANGKALSFQNMQDHPIRGTSGWTQYSLTFDVPHNADVMIFGILLQGTGQAWMDDLSLTTVGTAAESNHTSTQGVNPAPTNLNFDR